MSVRILNRSFSGGEITPELFGRLDLSKVQEALALCMNFITLPHGPVVNRPGTEYVEEVKNSANATRLIPFSYNNTQTFAIQLGAGYFRFHTQGGTLQCGALPAYVPSATVTIAISAPGVVTWNAHGLSAGAPVMFSTTGALPTGVTAGTTYYVSTAGLTANTFQLSSTQFDAANGAATITTTGTQSGTHTGSYSYTVGSAVSYGGTNYYCIQPNTNQPPPNSYWYAMPPNGDYEIPNPYAATDLMDIHYTQSADVLTLVHPNYPIQELRRYGATNWALNSVTFAPIMPAPFATGIVGSPVIYTYVVVAICNSTSVSGAGLYTSLQRGVVSASVGISNDLNQQGAYNIITWNAVQRAVGYNVYKIFNGSYYLLGGSSGTSFRDDASRSPILANLAAWTPFPELCGTPQNVSATAYNASVQNAVTVTATGSGSISYSYVVTALDGSSNESYPSAAATCTNNLATAGNYNTINIPAVSGAIRYNVYKLSYGIYGFIGQVAPQQGAISLVDNNITADISRTPPLVPDNAPLQGTGNYPAAVAYYQQRRMFAGTQNQPQNVWATRSGTESDLSYTIPSRDDNRLAFRIAAREASAIRHIVPLQDLLFLSASCEWKCSSTTGVLTPSTLNVQPQSYIGANNVQPVVVGNAVLYAAARGGHIRQMNYNWQINGYQSTDSSIFAPHLFDYNTIVDMAYSKGPIPILWCVSSSGKLLGMTYLPEQQIASWHQHTTGAADVFESVCVVSEAPANSTAIEDMLYCIVRRNINGTTHRFVERLHTRLYNTVSDCHYVDCGMTYTNPATNTGTFTRAGATLTCTIGNHGLTNGQPYWFAFSDSACGALPTGAQYTIGYVDANTFTVSVPVTPVTISIASPAVVTWNGHGFAAGSPVAFSTTGALPTGITAGTIYYVVNPTTNTFQIAATAGGAAIATSGSQSGTQSCYIAAGAVTHLPHIISGLSWLQGMAVNILADGAVVPPQVVTQTTVGNVPAGSVVLPVGATQVHVGLPLTAQLQTPPAAQQIDPAFAQGRAKNVNKVFLRTYRSSGILAGPDFADLTPYRQRSTEPPGSPPNLVSDEVEILLTADWGMSGQICIQQSDPLPLDIASMTLEIAVGGGV